MSFSPSGDLVASAADDGTARVWQASQGREAACFRVHQDEVWCVAFGNDGQVASGAGHHDCTVRIWDAASGKEILCLSGHTKGVQSVAFAPDGSRLASGSEDGSVRIWNTANGAELFRCEGHEGGVWDVCFSSDGSRLVSTSSDRGTRIWDSTTGACLETTRQQLEAAVVAGGPQVFPWRARFHDLDTEIYSANTHEAAAWLPFPLTRLDVATHPSGKAWAVRQGNDVLLFQVEDGKTG